MVRRVRRASSRLQGIAARSSPIRQTAAESRRDIRAATHRDPDVAGRQRRRVVAPSPIMQTGPNSCRARPIAAASPLPSPAIPWHWMRYRL